MAALNPLLEELRRKKEERIKEFTDVQLQIVRICAEIAGDSHPESPATFKVDEGDLTIKRLGELKSQLHELQLDKVSFLTKE